MVPYTSISRSHYTKSILRPQIRLVNQDLSVELCGAVAALLNGADVENILWGTNLLAAYTIPTLISVRFLKFNFNDRILIADI